MFGFSFPELEVQQLHSKDNFIGEVLDMATQKTVTKQESIAQVETKTLTRLERQAADKLVEKAVECTENVDKNYMTLAGVLHYLKEKELYRLRFGYDNFKDFVDEKIPNCGHRRAFYLVKLFEFTRKNVIHRDALKEIGWSKLKEIVPILLNGAPIREWVEKAREMPFGQLQEEVRRFRRKDPGQQEAARKLLPVRILKEDIDFIMEELEDIVEKNILDTKDKGTILRMIVQDWLEYYAA
jgi:dGTP triphosphohydrolase